MGDFTMSLSGELIPFLYKAKIYLTNILGQQIKVLFDNTLNAGKYKMQFNLNDQSKGFTS